MRKIWSYLAVGFAFFSGGIIFAVKYLNEKVVYKGSVKLKQRGKGNVQLADIRPKIDAKVKRDERKQARIVNRNQKKAKKSAKRLNNI